MDWFHLMLYPFCCYIHGMHSLYLIVFKWSIFTEFLNSLFIVWIFMCWFTFSTFSTRCLGLFTTGNFKIILTSLPFLVNVYWLFWLSTTFPCFFNILLFYAKCVQKTIKTEGKHILSEKAHAFFCHAASVGMVVFLNLSFVWAFDIFDSINHWGKNLDFPLSRTWERQQDSGYLNSACR